MELPEWFRSVLNGMAIVTYIALIGLVVKALRKWNPHYSVRTLFIVTTAVSVVMGAIAYLLRE
jgi:hypothetical protein